jgi:hypothetical protein
MQLISLLVFFVVAALATPPTPCNLPETFQAANEMLIMDDSGCQTSYSTGTVYYDYTAQVRLPQCSIC